MIDGVIENVLTTLAQHQDEPHYRELLHRLRLALDVEAVRLWAASPLWCGQPKQVEEEKT